MPALAHAEIVCVCTAYKSIVRKLQIWTNFSAYMLIWYTLTE